MIYTKIKGGVKNNIAGVTIRGQLITAPIEYSKFYFVQNAGNNVAVNVVPPLTGHRFVITDIIISGDRSIAANGAVVDIFENTIGPTDTTIHSEIYQDEIAKQTRAVLTGMNIIVTAGSWINMKADDIVVRANIAGYYVITG